MPDLNEKAAEEAGEEQEPTGEQTETDLGEATDEVEDPDTGDSSASDELSNELKALKEQLSRKDAEIERERENARLYQRFLDSQLGNKQQQTQEDPDAKLTPEMRELKKLLKPLFEDEIKRVTEPMNQVAGSLWEQNDAVNFQLTLSKKHPEYLDGDNFDKVNQAVESVRRRAAANGQTVGRLDAFYYAEGIGLLKGLKRSPKATVKQVKQNKAADAAQSSGGVKKGGNDGSAEINRIREKAGRGERLTDIERKKFKVHLEKQPGAF
jgi:hypothetical protein